MPKKQRFHIYAINIDGQVYVGSTNNTKRRLKDHRTRCFNPNAKHYPCKFYKYIRDKYNREIIYGISWRRTKIWIIFVRNIFW